MLARNKTYLGDCFEIMKSIDDCSIDIILTDPPYLYLDHKLDSNFDIDLFLKESFRILKNDSFLCFFGRGSMLYEMGYKATQQGFTFKEELIWQKQNSSSPFSRIARIHESIGLFSKGNKTLNDVRINKIEYDLMTFPDKIITDFKRILSSLKKINTFEDFNNWKTETKAGKVKHKITRSRNPDFDRGYGTYSSHTKGKRLSSLLVVPKEHYNFEHPTQKPVRLLELLLKLCSNKGDLILDPFFGSGSTGIASANIDRDYIGIEKKQEYFEIACNRIKEATAQSHFSF